LVAVQGDLPMALPILATMLIARATLKPKVLPLKAFSETLPPLSLVDVLSVFCCYFDPKVK
jgi:hypothetical protein